MFPLVVMAVALIVAGIIGSLIRENRRKYPPLKR